MVGTGSKENSAYSKAHEGLKSSLQKHLVKLFEVESAFNKCLNFADTYPFDESTVEAEKIEEYWLRRKGLRNLFIDETNQLDSLIKAVRQKDYKEEDKKHLFLIILGYMDVVEATTEGLNLYVPKSLPKDEELLESITKFNRLKKFVRLNIRGILPSL